MHFHDERPYSHCPMCGGALEPRSLRPKEPERLVCAACGFVFYLDPEVAAGTIIRDEAERILLLRRAIGGLAGRMVLPTLGRALLASVAMGGVVLALVEGAAHAAGYRRVELMATMPGVPLYRACGYTAGEPVAVALLDRGAIDALQ